jgi:ADP-ribosyltransferase exoenzyme
VPDAGERFLETGEGLIVRAGKPVKDFDPSEPRDEEGRWTDDGGGESTPHVPETAAFEPQWDKIKSDETASRLQFAIQKWVSEDFVEINHALRKGSLARDDERDEAIKSLDDAFQYAVATPRDYLVYRGMGPSHHTVGEEWQDKGFVSTSSSRSVANAFAETNGGYLVEVTIPKGTKMIAPMVSPDKDRRIYEEEQEGAEIVRDESELTLPRGSKFKITGKRHDVGSDQTIFEARVVT